MSTIQFILLSDLRVGRYYSVIKFYNGIRMLHIQLGKTEKRYVSETRPLGKLLEIRQYGRQYDPDIVLYFERENGDKFEFDPSFGSMEAYIEYFPDTEEKSMERIQTRTRLLQVEIEGNDWALRPENVVATQGIDVSHYKEGETKVTSGNP
jgi:hypothetical protein